jgi:hypothetical protein
MSSQAVMRDCGHDARSKNDIGHFAGAGLAADGHPAYGGNHAMDLTSTGGGSSAADESRSTSGSA